MTRLLLFTRPDGSGGQTPTPNARSVWGTPFVDTYDVSTAAELTDAIATAGARADTPVDPRNCYQIRLAPGTYEGSFGVYHPYLSIVGTGDTPDDVILHKTNPASSGLIRQYPMEIGGSTHLADLTLHGESQSYGLHADGGDFATFKQLICQRVHFLNTFGDYAIGLGCGGRWEMYYDACTFETTNSGTIEAAGNAPFFGHNQGDQPVDSLLVITDPTWLCGDRVGQWSDLATADDPSPDPDQFILTGGNRGGIVQIAEGAGPYPIAYHADAAYTPSGTGDALLDNAVPSPVPHWTDRSSPHNRRYGTY